MHRQLQAAVAVDRKRVRLLPHKRAVEKHRKERLGELFALGQDLLRYDGTSTYFEVEAAKNPQAQRGYSRDWARLSEGCYLLRSNVTDWSAEELRRAYLPLTEAEGPPASRNPI